MVDNSKYDGVLPTAFDSYFVVLLRPHPERKKPETAEEEAVLEKVHYGHLGHLKIWWNKVSRCRRVPSPMAPAVIAKRFVIQVHPLSVPQGQLEPSP